MTLPERTPWQTANRWGPVVLRDLLKARLGGLARSVLVFVRHGAPNRYRQGPPKNDVDWWQRSGGAVA